MNRSFCAVFLLCLLAVAGGIWFAVHQGRTERAVAQLNARYAPEGMAYQAAERPLSGAGVLFYQVSFPTLPVRHRADKLLVAAADERLSLRATDVRINVAETLRDAYGSALPQRLQSYRLPQDTLMRPLETLALLGVDVWRADVRIQAEYALPHTRVYLDIRQGRELLLQATLLMDVPAEAFRKMWGFASGKLVEASIVIENQRLLQAYAATAAAMQAPPMPALQKALDNGAPLVIFTHFDAPVPLAALLPV